VLAEHETITGLRGRQVRSKPTGALVRWTTSLERWAVSKRQTPAFGLPLLTPVEIVMHRFLLALAMGAAIVGCQPKAKFAPVSPNDTQTAVPAPEAPDLVDLDVKAANRFITAGQPEEVLARIHISTDAQPDQQRPQANIALVVDTSASMSGDAIEQARAAALSVVDALKPGDQLSVVTFHSRTDVLVPSTMIGEDTLPSIRTAIEGMDATGTTDLAGGLAEGLRQLQPQVRADVVSRVVLLSDGVPNDEGPMPNLANQAAAQNISIAALGLGLEYQETLLADLATRSGGRFHFVENPDEVAQMFEQEILHIDRLVALSSAVVLNAGPGVTIKEVVGHQVMPAGSRQATVPIGDLAEQEDKDIVVKLLVGEHRDGATVELLDAQLAYADAVVSAGRQERSAFLAVEATADESEQQSGLDLETELVVARAVTAAMTLQIVARARSGDVAGAKADLAKAEKRARALVKQTDDEALADLADELAALAPTLADLAPPKLTPAKRPNNRDRAPKKKAELGQSDIPMSAPRPAALKRAHSNAFNALH